MSIEADHPLIVLVDPKPPTSIPVGLSELIERAEKNGWNAAICAAREAQPCTAERPNEDSYQRGKFDGVMEYARALRGLHK